MCKRKRWFLSLYAFWARHSKASDWSASFSILTYLVLLTGSWGCRKLQLIRKPREPRRLLKLSFSRHSDEKCGLGWAFYWKIIFLTVIFFTEKRSNPKTMVIFVISRSKSLRIRGLFLILSHLSFKRFFQRSFGPEVYDVECWNEIGNLVIRQFTQNFNLKQIGSQLWPWECPFENMQTWKPWGHQIW